MNKIKLAYCPTRRDVFSTEEAMRFNRMIREKVSGNWWKDLIFIMFPAFTGTMARFYTRRANTFRS